VVLNTSELIRRILAGDKDEFRHLVAAFQDRVYSLLMRQTGDAAVSHDLAQEVFVRAYRHLASYRGDAEFTTWLTRIAINVANNWFSSRPYKERNRTISLDFEKYKESGEQQEAVLDEADAAMIRDAVAALKPHYREVVALCSFEGKSYAEAADLLGIPIGTVCSRMNKALCLMRTMLKEGKI
jgi:RNA polymerase sigma-70 factor, ECF subfamily